MRILFGVFLLLLVAGLILLMVLGRVSRTDTAAGLTSGKLSPCGEKPNCVVSEGSVDSTHQISPLAAPQDIQTLLSAVEAMGGTLQENTKDYWAFTFQSRGFGFVDDLEFRLDPEAKILHVRSASRVGYSDAGVNRARVERLRKNLATPVL